MHVCFKCFYRERAFSYKFLVSIGGIRVRKNISLWRVVVDLVGTINFKNIYVDLLYTCTKLYEILFYIK